MIRSAWTFVRGAFLVDVLRRCSYEGCWQRRWGSVYLGRYPVCHQHWSEWYSSDTSAVAASLPLLGAPMREFFNDDEA